MSSRQACFPDLRPHVGEIARRILGEPNKRLSNQTELRFGRNGSVSVEIAGNKRGQWYDHEEQQGGGPWELLTVKGGMANGAAFEWLRSELGIEIPHASKGARDRVATYDYRDERGDVLFQVCRFAPKDFRQRRPDGRGGWIWSTKGVRQVPYRLPELLAAPTDQPVFVVEGEKNADRLASIGLVTTCNPGGVGKWLSSYAVFFRGREMVVLPDNDDAGLDHARSVAANLVPVASSVRILELPDLAPKGDVSDWLAAGGTAEQLHNLAAAARVCSLATEEFARPDSATPPEFSDEALALEFADRHADELRHVAALDKWFIWTGTHWRADDTMQTFDLARAVCRSASGLVPPKQQRLALAVASARTAAAAERLARADRRHAMPADRWDSDSLIFNTPIGREQTSDGQPPER
jgi:putative DNA primase/helicase